MMKKEGKIVWTIVGKYKRRQSAVRRARGIEIRGLSAKVVRKGNLYLVYKDPKDSIE